MGEYSNAQPDASRAVSGPPQPASIVVIGCSGHARVALDIIAEEGRFRVAGLIDSYKPIGTELLGYQILGREEDVRTLIASGVCDGVLVAVGDNWARGELVSRLRNLAPDIRFVTAVHPSARIARGVPIGRGTIVMAGAIVNTGSQIGEFCILNTASSLDHDCTMEDFSSLAPRAVTGGGVKIGAFSAVAIGAVVSHEITIGKHSVIGAGATVLRDLPDRVVAYGTPARVVRERNPGDPYLGAQTAKGRWEPTPSKAMRGTKTLNKVMLIPPTSSQWQLYLDRTKHDFFHRAEYHLLNEEFGGGAAWLAVFGDSSKFIAWPFILRDVAPPDRSTSWTLSDVGCVYGYTGPVSYGTGKDGEFLAAAWAALLDAWRSQGVVSVFTRYHPILANYDWLESRTASDESPEKESDPHSMGCTVAIDLSRTQEDIWVGYSRQLRQALRRCMAAGLTTIIDENWTSADELIPLYYRTMRRNNAAGFYYFSAEYFRKLRVALGRHGVLIVTRCDGAAVGAGLLIEYGGIATMHLLASDDSFSSASPSKCLIHAAQAWAQRRGNRYLHLGGGRAGRDDDSLFRFKRMFSDVTFPFHTGRWVLNQDVYNALCEQRLKTATALGREGRLTSYFPLYRAPFVTDASPRDQEPSAAEHERDANSGARPSIDVAEFSTTGRTDR